MNFREVGELENDTVPFHVTWRIANFMSLSGKVDTYYSSPLFYFSTLRWFLRIYPKGNVKGSGEWIEIYLRRSHGPPVSVRYTFCIKKADGTENRQTSVNSTFTQYDPSWGIRKFLKRSELLKRQSELAPSGVLTVVCRMWIDVEEQSLVSRESQTEVLADSVAKGEVCAHLNTKGGAILLKHLQDLLLTDKDHDVTLKVKDKQFRAHRCMLRARSPVFDAMFAHSTTENECGGVVIEDCDPNAFGEFLKYVYVGKLENISPITATGVYYAADKYDFPDLKETCVQFLKASLTTNWISDVITLAVKHGEDELLEVALEYFSKHMTEIFRTVEWQHFITRNPILANEINIKASMKVSLKNTE